MQYSYHARGPRPGLCARPGGGPRDAGGPQGRGRWEAQTVKKMARPCGKDDREAGGPRREDHTATSHAMASVMGVPAARSVHVSVARRGWGRGIGWRGACPGTCALRDAMTRTVGGREARQNAGTQVCARASMCRAWGEARDHEPARRAPRWRHPCRADPRGQAPWRRRIGTSSPYRLPDGLCGGLQVRMVRVMPQHVFDVA